MTKEELDRKIEAEGIESVPLSDLVQVLSDYPEVRPRSLKEQDEDRRGNPGMMKKARRWYAEIVFRDKVPRIWQLSSYKEFRRLCCGGLTADEEQAVAILCQAMVNHKRCNSLVTEARLGKILDSLKSQAMEIR